MDKRNFSEEEVREILAKGLRLQNASDDHRIQLETRLSMAELEEIAHEVGISQKHLQQAVESIEAGPKVFQNNDFIGAPNYLAITTKLKRELTDTAIVAITKKLRSFFHVEGTLEKIGKHFSWVAPSNDSNINGQPSPGKYLRFEGNSTKKGTELTLTYAPSLVRVQFHAIASIASIFSIFWGLNNKLTFPVYMVLVSLLVATNLFAHFGYKKFFKFRSRKIYTQFKEIEELALTLINADNAEASRQDINASRIDLEQVEGYESNSLDGDQIDHSSNKQNKDLE